MKTNKLRKQRADERNAANAGASKAQKIARLDARLGAGVGAKKERAKLAK